MKLIILLLLILISLSDYSLAQDSSEAVTTKIFGVVKGDKDILLRGANLVIEGTIDGATTDEKGYYEFETEKMGQQKSTCHNAGVYK